MKQLLIGTGNRGKFKEIANILSHLPHELVGLHDLPVPPGDVEETGTTHRENAEIKARHFHPHSQHLTLAEDSGIEVDALKGELGLHTRRWGAGPEASDEAWLDFFLNRMDPIPDDQRTARFLCAAILIDENGQEYFFEGESSGIITREPEAPILPGLPLSSVFKPHGYDRVYAALTQDEKAAISHRGWAITKVRDFLSN